jgi:hypothetical protein
VAASGFQDGVSEQFEELSLLWAWGAELCLTIIGPSQAKSPLSTRMRAAALCHAGVVRELAVLRATVSSAADLVLGHSPDETSRVEVMTKLTTNFRRLEELCSQLEGPSTRICGLLLGGPPGKAQWPDHLDEATGRLEADFAERRQVSIKLVALQTSARLVQDLVLANIDRPSPLVACVGAHKTRISCENMLSKYMK